MVKYVNWLGKKTQGFTFGKTIYLNANMTFSESQLEVIINHESIHLAQYKECTWVGFILIYLINFLLICWKFPIYAIVGTSVYRRLLFEQEAYKNEKNLNYLQTRKPFAWLKN